MTTVSASPPKGTIQDWLDERARSRPDDISHLFPGNGALTWQELRDLSREIAGRLTGLGIQPSESVALMLPNCRAAVELLFGILYGGFRLTPVNIAAGPTTIAHVLEHSGARYVFLDQERTETARCSTRSVSPEHQYGHGRGPWRDRTFLGSTCNWVE